jgi:uncharacterized protein (TIGR00369 family)
MSDSRLEGASRSDEQRGMSNEVITEGGVGAADAERWAAQARHFESRVHFNRACNVHVDRWDDQAVVMTLPHDEWKCNSTTGLHGGVIAALADTCGTAASLAAIGGTGFIATVSMQINYLAVAESAVTATGVCIKPGQRIQVSEVKVTDEAGRLVAAATVTTMQPTTRAPEANSQA